MSFSGGRRGEVIVGVMVVVFALIGLIGMMSNMMEERELKRDADILYAQVEHED